MSGSIELLEELGVATYVRSPKRQITRVKEDP